MPSSISPGIPSSQHPDPSTPKDFKLCLVILLWLPSSWLFEALQLSTSLSGWEDEMNKGRSHLNLSSTSWGLQHSLAPLCAGWGPLAGASGQSRKQLEFSSFAFSRWEEEWFLPHLQHSLVNWEFPIWESRGLILGVELTREKKKGF